MSFFISDAMAETAPAQAQGDPFGPLLMMVLIFVLFYFLLIRPQAKRAKEHKQMVEALAKNDEVVTNGGILGKVVEVDESFLTVEIADNVRIKVQRQAVATLVPKGTYKA
ncbi:MAG: preprotein translocase subunit YajC [Gammaproteobacteria bacterium]|nr:preprotein translocase subunit YajC [Gammaproteobacteria bacterium]MDH5799310.1 preprotein translocase subunit YajC [Gammaproteobacteria bacterium]